MYIREKERGREHQLHSLLGSLSKKQLRMEFESKDRKQRNYNTFLTAFVAVTFTLALLQGVGLVIFYSHFQVANTALEARIAAVEARELAVAALEAAPSDSNTGEAPGTSAELYRVSPSHCSTVDACTLAMYTHPHHSNSFTIDAHTLPHVAPLLLLPV